MADYDAVTEIWTNWNDQSRWGQTKRPYAAADVVRLRGSLQIEYTLARQGAWRLWKLFQSRPYVAALGATTGNQAIEQVRAGLSAIYASGWPAVADGNQASEIYPHKDLSLSDCVPNLVRNINRSLQRADQIHHAQGKTDIHWFAPIVADAESGLGGNLNSFELTKALIEAGAAAVHFADNLLTTPRSSHLAGRILIPTQEFIEKLIAARLAADVMGVPTLLIARTDASTANLITYDSDSSDLKFITRERTGEGYLSFRGGLEAAIDRGLAYAPYADLLWCATSAPDLKEAQRFAAAIHGRFPGKLLAYNCSSSFNWVKQLDATTIRNFQAALGAMGYKFQFVNDAGFHSLNLGMFDLARSYRETGMAAYVRLQKTEFELAESYGYEAVKHQQFVGAGYFDDIAQTIAGGTPSNASATGPAEQKQAPLAPSRPRPQGPRSFGGKAEVIRSSARDGFKNDGEVN